MVQTLSRRNLLSLAAAAGMAPVLTGEARAATGLQFGPARAFSYEDLKAMARERAGKPYVAPPRPNPEIVARIDYDNHGKLRFNKDFALFGTGPGAYPVTFQHVGQYFPKTVRMHALANGQAREILYDNSYFTIQPDHPAAKLPAEPSAFAGLWLQEARSRDWKKDEPWATWLGASYFRAVGELGQVGLSARGIALSPGQGPGPEEFPDFVAFWVETAEKETDPVTLYALLDGPSLTGAYRFQCRRTSGVIMDIEATLNFRARVTQLGVAPLTSMYWYSETTTSRTTDWRPEVHDSDGLAIWTGAGERIWRPLNNPPRTMTSSFVDHGPRGFGLLQRDREFLHYLDGVKYEKRPSAWVEPLGDWGRGAVQIVELPTDDEIHDNIVAMWVPEEASAAGSSREYRYRLHWLADEPTPTPLARVVATRLGRGGQPGQPRPPGVRKFLIEFKGGPLANLPKGVIPEPVLSASRGSFGDYKYTEAVPNDVPGHWRTQFDLKVEGSDPVEMRCYLKVGDQVASETWLYQYHPQA
ncbi:glucan biosynthesis protein [Phreatobacter stygius]|uniref:Glucan biosynthesis protein D n=1 Tax=Phreatobacter stygius TaxID=1940610 RepID=A0A4D7B3Q1_9HYPH|nr:glucan biosynthesis protein D [Phreatobacter stygius]QCI64680.1 glucan biosynthesis protein D [Phreatobacter stygius]